MGTPELGSTKAASNLASDSQRTNRSTANFAYLREVVFEATDRIASRPSIRTWLAATIFRSFGGTFLFTLFFAVFSYFAVVTIVNPRGVFWGQAFPEIMPNTRMLKLDLLQQYNRTGKVGGCVGLIVDELSPDLVQSLTGEQTFSAGVFSGAPNDYLSIYRVMKQQGIAPKLCWLGRSGGLLKRIRTDFSQSRMTSALGGTVPNLSKNVALGPPL
jgi:hypothetical protein